MRRNFLILVATLATAALVTTAAVAANAHFKKGSPRFTDNGTTLTASGAIAGLGNGDVRIRVLATGSPTAGCVNPGTGEHRPGGQQPAVVVSGTQDIAGNEIKNGVLSFSVTTSPPTPPTSAKAAGCPNDNWTVAIDDVSFTDNTVCVYQDAINDGAFNSPSPLVLSAGPLTCPLDGVTIEILTQAGEQLDAPLPLVEPFRDDALQSALAGVRELVAIRDRWSAAPK